MRCVRDGPRQFFSVASGAPSHVSLMTRQKLENYYLNTLRSNPHPLKFYLFWVG